MYKAFDYFNIEYDCQYNYLQLKYKLLSHLVKINPSKENIGRKLDFLKANEIYISPETRCIYLIITSNKALKFNYGKYIEVSDANCFIYNFIWVLLYYYGVSEKVDNLFITFEDFINFMNNPKYNYTDELRNKILKAFGNTEEIQNLLKLSPYDLFCFLCNKFNHYNKQLQIFFEERRFNNLHVSLLESVKLQSDVLFELGLLIEQF